MQRVNMIFFLINHWFLLAHPIWIVRVCVLPHYNSFRHGKFKNKIEFLFLVYPYWHRFISNVKYKTKKWIDINNDWFVNQMMMSSQNVDELHPHVIWSSCSGFCDREGEGGIVFERLHFMQQRKISGFMVGVACIDK